MPHVPAPATPVRSGAGRWRPAVGAGWVLLMVVVWLCAPDSGTSGAAGGGPLLGDVSR